MATGASVVPEYYVSFAKSVKEQLLLSGGEPIIISWEGTMDEFFNIARTHIMLPIYVGELKYRSYPSASYDFLIKLDMAGEFSTATYELDHNVPAAELRKK